MATVKGLLVVPGAVFLETYYKVENSGEHIYKNKSKWGANEATSQVKKFCKIFQCFI